VSTSGSLVIISRAGPAQVAKPGTGQAATGEIVREIDDPNTGARWLLRRDPSHPGGPGRMVLGAQSQGHALGNAANATEIGGQHDGAREAQATAPVQPVIRSGDRLIVEEHTSVVDASLEAVALNPAAVGSSLMVRLAIGGRLVRAVALAPGRASFQAEIGAGQ
jgi:hypothetical protein